jgi:hypothetical protein
VARLVATRRVSAKRAHHVHDVETLAKGFPAFAIGFARPGHLAGARTQKARIAGKIEAEAKLTAHSVRPFYLADLDLELGIKQFPTQTLGQ